jgi:hypothetical protein
MQPSFGETRRSLGEGGKPDTTYYGSGICSVTGMRLAPVLVLCMVAMIATGAAAQQGSPLAPTPKTIAAGQLADIGKMEDQLVQMSALVRHTDTAQVFTIGDKQGREIHVVVPYPATDGATVGDTVVLTGFVRRFDASKFEKDYQWFRRTDYPGVRGGDWVIVATSVRTSEGTELVPPMTISTTPPAAKTK